MANDALNITVEITGRGNIDLITLPEFVFPVDFEVGKDWGHLTEYEI